MHRIAITASTFGQWDKGPLELLESQGLQPILNPHGRTLKREELVRMASGCVGLIAGTESLDQGALSALKGLKVISRCGTGLENIDVDEASRLAIKVYHTPDAPVLAVAELTMGLMLDLLRKISQIDRGVREGIWKKEMGELLSGKKVGIVGFGRVGKKLARLLSGFGVALGFYDIRPMEDSLARAMPLDDLLAWSDIVTLHCSAARGGGPLLGERELGLMKEGAFLVNTSRGELVDEGALVRCLEQRKLGGAAMDVFPQEPYTGRLRDFPNTVLTAHVGSYARDSRIEMEKEAVRNLLHGLEACSVILARS